MEKRMVLGIGNQLMMDDGIGIYLVEELAQLNSIPHMEYIIGESDIDYCIEQIDRATFIIIIDAVYAGKGTGEITIYPIQHLHENNTLDISPHNLHLFQVLFQQRDTLKGYLIGVEPDEITFHIGLSPPIRKQWNQILEEVTVSIQKLISLEFDEKF